MATLSAPNPQPAHLYNRIASPRTPLPRQPFDKQYLDRLAQGDPETAAHFTHYFTKLLLLKLRSKLRSSFQIEDAAQETLLRVLKHLREKGGIDHPERLGAFVHSFCDNVVHEFYRAGSRFQQVPENAPEPVSQALNAEVNCITAERKSLIAKALGELDEKDRVIIQKVFLEEQDKDNICGELGINRDYLRVRVHRALAHFRGHLIASENQKPRKVGIV